MPTPKPSAMPDAPAVGNAVHVTRHSMNNLGPGGGPDFLPGRSPKAFQDQTDPGGMSWAQIQGRGLHDQEDPDEDPDGEMVEEELVGTLPECPPGMRYVLEREPTGEINVVLVPDDGEGDTLSTHDRTFRHRLVDGPDPVLRRMNQIHRGRYSRDAATMRRTMFRVTPAKNEHVEVIPNSTPGGTGGWDVVLVSTVYDPIEPPPKGAQKLNMSPEDDDEVWMPSDATTGRGGENEFIRLESSSGSLGGKGRDHRSVPVSTRAMIRSMNQANARFWGR